MSTEPSESGIDFDRTPVPGVPLDIVWFLLSLPREVRINCANFLNASTIEGFDGTPEITAGLWKNELQRRIDAFDRGEMKGYTLKEVMARVRLRLEQLARTPHPDHLHGYSCVDYFADGWAEKGFYDEVAHLWVIEPLRELNDERRDGFFAVGGPGADGIRFCYRYGHEGVWTFYPITREFVPVAKNVNELVEKWRAGELTV